MRNVIIMSLFAVFAAAAAYPQCSTPLPTPLLHYLGATDGAPGYFNVWFSIGNYASYDNTLFVASPSLPACGLNKNASRTWLDIDTDGGTYIYGYCALSSNAELKKLSFPWKKTVPLPKGFFVRLRDRKCSHAAQSATHFGF